MNWQRVSSFPKVPSSSIDVNKLSFPALHLHFNCMFCCIVVGDRRLLRFLRGKAMNVEEAIKNIRAFFKWRDDNKIDEIRQDIVYGGKDSPFKFPHGKTLIDLAPQIIISTGFDRKGRPLGKGREAPCGFVLNIC
jgi:hypothetical protein